MTDLAALAQDACAAGRAAGLDAVGVASAEPFAVARAALLTRRAAGLDGGMQFTYRNPERSTEPGRALAGARALIVGARSYRRADPEPPTASAPGGSDGPRARIARYSWRDHYAPLREALAAAAAVLTAAGFRARVLADDNALVDRAAARRAGLGWFGKNANLLLHGAGSWFVLGAVVTDAPLPAAGTERDGDLAAAAADGCGSCVRCLDACPTGAIVAPGVVDARRCLAWLLEAPGPFPVEHRAALGDRIYGCDECQEVCPPNRLHDRRRPPAPAERDAETTVDLLAVLAAGDAELLARYGRWYLAGRDPRLIRRNALVALGTTARPGDGRVAAALARVADGDDPLLAEHARWAAAELARRAGPVPA